MSQRLRLSKPNYNVLTDTDLNHIVFDSGYDTLKYYVSGSKSVSVSSGVQSASDSVTHSLGYAPFFAAYLELTFSVGAGNWTHVPFTSTSGADYSVITAYVDTSKIYFKATTTDSGGFGAMTLNFKYKIFRNDTTLL